MTINDIPFTEAEIDFSGKFSTDMRNSYLLALRECLEEEYQDKIAGRHVTFYYQRMSSMDNYYISEKEMDKFELKIEIKRAIAKRRLQEQMKKAS